MRTAKKLLALLLALVMCVALFAGCGNKDNKPAETQKPDETQNPGQAQDPDVPAEPKTMVSSVEQGLEGKFSPFFSLSVGDTDIAEMTQVGLFPVDRVGNPVLNSIEGETRSYNGTDYTYTGLSNVVITENADGTVDYDITMRDDIVFSDGTPATIDDVLFYIYVVLDPTYDGNSTLYSVPIKGVNEYRSGMDTLFNLLIAAGEDNTDFTHWDQATQDKFWNEDLPAAGAAFAQSIVDYCVNAGYCAADDDISDQAANWGFDVPAGGTVADFWDVMVEDYEGDYMTLSDVENAGAALSTYAPAEYGVGITTGDAAPNVSGIVKTGDYSMRITTDTLDATAIYQFSFYVPPMHYYGDPAQFDVSKNQFGFPKGDLSIVRAKTTEPMGAGPYVYKDYSDGVVYMEANPLYYKGEPAIKYMNFREQAEADKVPAVATGLVDVSDPSYSAEVVKSIQDYNGNGELVGSKLTTVLIDYRGYGYVGCNPNLVKVGDDPYSEASKALRRAILTMMSVYRDEGVLSYYGETASIINYPISNTSWAAPQVTDDGYQVAYSTMPDGSPIYSDGMSQTDKYAAANDAVLAWLEKAGFTIADGKVTAAPDGAKLSYTVEIGANGSGDHPTFLTLKNAGEALTKLGLELVVRDHANANDLYATYQNGVAEFWVAAWRAGTDPDMFQLYHSNGSTNYYHISDEELDELIMAGRASTNQTVRKSIYQAAMEIIMEYGVELPVYQRSDCSLFSTERVKMSSIENDLTPYWSWMANIQTVEAN